MNAMPGAFQHACGVDSVIATAELDFRPRRKVDAEVENRVIIPLTREMAQSPENFFKKLVNAVLEVSQADSAGISLLNKEEGRFVWPAIAGNLDCFVGSGTPSDFGPCGTVLERESTILFVHPEKHFTYLEPIQPPLEEVLLVPFYVDGRAVGTIWAVIHKPGRKFDAEDKRLLESLSSFAASAYQMLSKFGALQPMLQMRPASAQ